MRIADAIKNLERTLADATDAMQADMQNLDGRVGSLEACLDEITFKLDAILDALTPDDDAH